MYKVQPKWHVHRRCKDSELVRCTFTPDTPAVPCGVKVQRWEDLHVDGGGEVVLREIFSFAPHHFKCTVGAKKISDKHLR